MSYMATLIIQPNGDVVGAGEEYECRNASLAGPVAWRSIGEKYLGPYHWQTGYRDDTDRRPREEYAERAWRLKDDPRIEFHDWIVLLSTFDYFACKLEHIKYLAAAFRKFHAEDTARKSAERLPSHYATLAEHLGQILTNHATSTEDEVIGIAYYMHSCGCVEWTKNGRGGRPRAYNVKKDKGHWWFNPADYQKR